MFGSSVAFFNKGVTRAILKDGGTVPLLMHRHIEHFRDDRYQRAVMIFQYMCQDRIRRARLVLVADFMIPWRTSSSVASLNDDK